MLPIAFCTLLLTANPIAGAPQALNFNGFLTQTVSYLDDDITYDSGIGKKTEYNYGSVAGLQLHYKYDDDIDVTMQLTSSLGEQFSPKLDWAYARYAISDSINVKIGKIRAPVFSKSDHLNVSYAYLWVKPPIEIYALVPFDSITGIELAWEKQLGRNTLAAQLVTGESVTDIPGTDFAGRIDFYDLIVTKIAYSTMDLQVYASYASVGFNYQSNPSGLTDLANLYASNGIDTGDALRADKRLQGEYFGLGVDYQYSDWVFAAEFGKRRATGIIGDNIAWSMTLSRYIGNYQPYVGFNKVNDKDNDRRKFGIPPIDAELVQSLGSGQKSTILGVRYDFRPNMALKLQWQQSEAAKSDGSFSRPTDRPVNIFMLSYSAVF